MSTDELELEALKLAPRERARLAEKLLESLETLSDEEKRPHLGRGSAAAK